MNKIGLLEYSRMSADEVDSAIFYGLRVPSKPLDWWWRTSYALRRVRARISQWVDRRGMVKANGLYYDRTIAWRGRTIWWSAPNQPDNFNMWADGDWVAVPEPIRDITILEVFINDFEEQEVFIMTITGENYRLTGNPDNPDLMQLERAEAVIR